VRLNAPVNNIMAKKSHGAVMWSMKSDRELIAMAKTKTLEALAAHFQRPPASILAKARKLGLTIKQTEN
jgi:hypothetical protein